jgi:hypothetical protein
MATDGIGLDPAVRERVIAQIDAFEEALDDAATDPSAYAWDRLREAADELMRAVAAVILELGKQP